MSVIAVKVEKDKIVLGADSIVVWGNSQLKNQNAKIFKVSDSFGIAGTGYSKDISLLFLFAKTHTPSVPTPGAVLDFFDEFYDWVKKKTETYPDEALFIIVYQGAVFTFHDFNIEKVEDYCAYGAGGDFARAALYLGADVEKALDVACELSTLCEAPKITYTFIKGEKE